MYDVEQIAEHLRQSFRGRLAFDPVTRGIYSTDASPFEIMPLGVAFPLDADDLSVLVSYCAEHLIPIIPRGAGTGVAGESLGPGLIIDLSVHFRSIPESSHDTVTVESGVTLTELNAYLAQRGRRFVPDPASAASCTIGGMVATNASGGNAIRHGYTRDHVAALEIVWDNGEKSLVRSKSSSGDGSRTAAIHSATAMLLRKNLDAIRVAHPRARFNRCGYILHDVLTDDGVDLPRLMCGSEGTLGIVTAAILRTVPLAGGTCVMLLGFGTFDAALRAGLSLRESSPISCDLLDRRLISLTRLGGQAEAIGGISSGVGAALLVMFEAETEREAHSQGCSAVTRLRENHRLVELIPPTCEPEGMARARAIRELGVAGLYALGNGPRPLAFVEDVAVPLEVLPEFIAHIQNVLQQHELTASFLVHVLAGQVHARPLIDLASPADRDKLWPVAEAIHSRAIELGGTVSSQHGTGIARTPWIEKQYGEVLPIFRELKLIFDPKGLLNPGKIIGPDPSRPAWSLRAIPARATDGRTPILAWSESSPAAEAAKCTGCGDCRPHSPRGRMCPIFRATGLEEASPRAKVNTVRLAGSLADLGSDEINAIAHRCVNCKMCREECPAKVDVSKLMLEVKATRHAIHGLDRADWILARAESLAAIGSNFGPLVNGILENQSARWFIEKVFGLSRSRRLPAFALRSFFRRARGLGLTRKRNKIAGNNGVPMNPSTPIRPRVAYFIDLFANYNDPLIGMATVAVLRHNGVEVYVPPRQLGSGISPLAQGDIETAREIAESNIRYLADLVREGYRVVCSEPTAALMLTQEYANILTDPDAAALAANTVELTEYLWELHQSGRLRTDFRQLDLNLGHHVPCHIKALHGPTAGPKLLELIPGVTVDTIDVSCSGMGGTWGIKTDNYTDSLRAGERMFEAFNRPRIRFGSTECSACRLQMQEGSGKRTLHPVQYLAYAYGLLPEIGKKLHRPLGDLVSD